MSVQDQLTYKFVRDSGTPISLTRTITGDNGGKLDFAVPNSSVNLPAAFSIVLDLAKLIFLYCDQAVTLKAGGTNAVKTLSMAGPPTAGTFTATLGVATSAAIAYNATAAQVQSALEAMSTIGTGNVVCSGGPLPGTPVVLTFEGSLAVQAVVAMTTTDSLTGGTSSIAETTAGVGPDTTINLLASVPLVWDSQAYFAQPFSADVSMIRVSNSSGADANLKVRTNSAAN